MADVGYGQQDPGDNSTDYGHIAFAIAQALAKVSTAKLVKVIAVNSSAMPPTVDVQPLVNQLDGQGNSSPHGTIFGIPYIRYQGGINAIIADPAVNDIGYMVCADRDISVVKGTQAQGNPGSYRKHDAADGVYFGGLLNGAPQQFIKFLAGGISITDKNGNSLVSSSSGWKLTGNLEVTGVTTLDGNLQLAGTVLGQTGGTYSGNIHTSGTVSADTNVVTGSVDLATHHHVDSRGGNTTGPVG